MVNVRWIIPFYMAFFPVGELLYFTQISIDSIDWWGKRIKYDIRIRIGLSHPFSSNTTALTAHLVRLWHKHCIALSLLLLKEWPGGFSKMPRKPSLAAEVAARLARRSRDRLLWPMLLKTRERRKSLTLEVKGPCWIFTSWRFINPMRKPPFWAMLRSDLCAPQKIQEYL